MVKSLDNIKEEVLCKSTGYAVVALAFFTGIFSLLQNGCSVPVGVKPDYALIQIGALAIGAGISLFKGISQRRKARKLEQQNIRPTYRTAQAVLDNVALARQSATEGLPAQVYNNQLSQLQQGQAQALRNNFLYGGNNSNANALVRQYNQGVLDLNAQDATARAQNRQELYRANTALAQEQQSAFQWNQAMPHMDAMRRVESLRSAGDANIFAGAGGILGAAASGAFNDLLPQTSGATTVANQAGGDAFSRGNFQTSRQAGATDLLGQQRAATNLWQNYMGGYRTLR